MLLCAVGAVLALACVVIGVLTPVSRAKGRIRLAGSLFIGMAIPVGAIGQALQEGRLRLGVGGFLARDATHIDYSERESDSGSWPQGVPVQIHGMDADEILVDEGDLNAARAIVASTADAALFLYPGDRHLFADNSLPSYDASAAALLTERALRFLAEVRAVHKRSDSEVWSGRSGTQPLCRTEARFDCRRIRVFARR